MSTERYIDANKIRLIAVGNTDENGDVLVSMRDVRKAIAQTPTADVVEVVRCKNCVHRGSRQRCDGRKPDYYCADGVRKERE